MEEITITLSKIHKQYGTRVILNDLDFKVLPGKFYSVMGPSGCGKSTLLHILGLLDQFEGSYQINGKEVRLGEFSRIRNQKLGFVFQLYYLLPNLTAMDNILQPFMYADRETGRNAQDFMEELLERLQLQNLLDKKVELLSGGEKQRVAVARAMILNPNLLLADEPTGALDEKNSREMMEIFRDYVKRGHSVVMVTHDPAMAKMADCCMYLQEGKLYEIT